MKQKKNSDRFEELPTPRLLDLREKYNKDVVSLHKKLSDANLSRAKQRRLEATSARLLGFRRSIDEILRERAAQAKKRVEKIAAFRAVTATIK